ncbi:mannosyl-oligosaccharide alpha-1,2-mannosidase [Rhizophlyctis rosea]|uniref:alpha-1,2-Mannosidase n=1 Tax=Rhizophlyctis rosea TaxID=64517 RepID=A0AAD5SD09_9FUNG|nr:mannosyl-oligosaccharide alpha-1,2-mannosidase [Rhizophlyctis rosea]
MYKPIGRAPAGLPMYKAGRPGDNDDKYNKRGTGFRATVRQVIARRRWERVIAVILLVLVIYYYYPRADETDTESQSEDFTPTPQIALAQNGSTPTDKAADAKEQPSPKAPIPKIIEDGKAAVQDLAEKIAQQKAAARKDAKPSDKPADSTPPPPAPSSLTPSEEKALWKSRQNSVAAAFRHAWTGYTKYAWGYDHLKPISQKGDDWFGVGMTIIDSLDTAYIMGEMDIFKNATEWVAKDLKYDSDYNSNVFELTIRVLGGLLSAFHLSGEKEKALLDKAVELADILLHSFSTPSGFPLASVNFRKREGQNAHNFGGASSTSEVATLQMEFKYLTHLTKNPKYWNVVQEVSRKIGAMPKKDGLVPLFIDPRHGTFLDSDYRLGSRADSYYEYLEKQYLQTNSTEPTYHKEFLFAMDGIRKHLLALTRPSELFYVGELQQSPSHKFVPKMDHLVCFLPAVLALSASKGKRVTPAERLKLSWRDRLDLDLAEELTRGCWEQYRQSNSGLASEIVYWREDQPPPEGTTPSLARKLLKIHKEAIGANPTVSVLPTERYLGDSLVTNVPEGQEDRAEIRPTLRNGTEVDFDIYVADAHNLLRPETVEALFTLWRVTGKRKYREWGWEIFEAFERWTKVDTGGYSSLHDVRKIPPTKTDKMETFFLGETLKYLYLLFRDEDEKEGGENGLVVRLDEYVFNTEAHPLPIFTVDEGVKKDLVWW